MLPFRKLSHFYFRKRLHWYAREFSFMAMKSRAIFHSSNTELLTKFSAVS